VNEFVHPYNFSKYAEIDILHELSHMGEMSSGCKSKQMHGTSGKVRSVCLHFCERKQYCVACFVNLLGC